MLNKSRGFLGNKRGDTNTIGFIVLLVFIILAVAPQIETIGITMSKAITTLDGNLGATLTPTPSD